MHGCWKNLENGEEQKSFPIVVHGDKLKLCYSETQSNWLVPKSRPEAVSTELPTTTSGSKVCAESVEGSSVASPNSSRD